MTKMENWKASRTEPTLWPLLENDDRENPWGINLIITHGYIGNKLLGGCSGTVNVVDCLTQDRKVAGTSFTSGTVLCP